MERAAVISESIWELHQAIEVEEVELRGKKELYKTLVLSNHADCIRAANPTDEDKKDYQSTWYMFLTYGTGKCPYCKGAGWQIPKPRPAIEHLWQATGEHND